MSELLRIERGLRNELRKDVIGPFKREAGDRGERLELGESLEPAEGDATGTRAPRLERERTPKIPHQHRADEEAEDFVVAGIKEADDTRKRGHLARRGG